MIPYAPCMAHLSTLAPEITKKMYLNRPYMEQLGMINHGFLEQNHLFHLGSRVFWAPPGALTRSTLRNRPPAPWASPASENNVMDSSLKSSRNFKSGKLHGICIYIYIERERELKSIHLYIYKYKHV